MKVFFLIDVVIQFFVYCVYESFVFLHNFLKEFFVYDLNCDPSMTPCSEGKSVLQQESAEIESNASSHCFDDELSPIVHCGNELDKTFLDNEQTI